MNVTEIKSAIAQLSAEDLFELMARLQQTHDRVWNKQIKDDLTSGRLDSLVSEADDEYSRGLAKPL